MPIRSFSELKHVTEQSLPELLCSLSRRLELLRQKDVHVESGQVGPACCDLMHASTFLC